MVGRRRFSLARGPSKYCFPISCGRLRAAVFRRGNPSKNAKPTYVALAKRQSNRASAIARRDGLEENLALRTAHMRTDVRFTVLVRWRSQLPKACQLICKRSGARSISGIPIGYGIPRQLGSAKNLGLRLPRCAWATAGLTFPKSMHNETLHWASPSWGRSVDQIFPGDAML